MAKTLPLYYSCTGKIIINGNNTNFWHDSWLGKTLRSKLVGPLPRNEDLHTVSTIFTPPPMVHVGIFTTFYSCYPKILSYKLMPTLSQMPLTLPFHFQLTGKSGASLKMETFQQSQHITIFTTKLLISFKVPLLLKFQTFHGYGNSLATLVKTSFFGNYTRKACPQIQNFTKQIVLETTFVLFAN